MTGDNVVIEENNIDGGWNNMSTLLHPSALGYLAIFPLGLELAHHLPSFNYCLQNCSQF